VLPPPAESPAAPSAGAAGTAFSTSAMARGCPGGLWSGGIGLGSSLGSVWLDRLELSSRVAQASRPPTGYTASEAQRSSQVRARDLLRRRPPGARQVTT
jgi:hypothetical protein